MRYPVEIVPSMLPGGMGSIRLAGYTGVRPYVPEKIYQELRGSDGPLIATLSLAGSAPEITGLESAVSARPIYGVAVD